MRMMVQSFDVFSFEPSNNLLKNREDNEAYCMTNKDESQFALYFPDGGEVDIDLKQSSSGYVIKWLDIINSQWRGEEKIEGGDGCTFKTPGKGHWGALIKMQ